ncbi:hypothetical protein D5R40_26825 [Okeania hirsuta]|uniref:Uncharacterized protein n=1 Tax=Okeania hirsuta TaxID=1458930 RepID=A0A3N6P445_9CYAN|nr:hypothetical protein D5R40_26825 [Okeania hirsuta]
MIWWTSSTSKAQAIKAKMLLIGYVLFDRDPALQGVDVVKDSPSHRTIEQGLLEVRRALVIALRIMSTSARQQAPESGCAGCLSIGVYSCLLQFRSVAISLMVFSEYSLFCRRLYPHRWYDQAWFLLTLFGKNMRDLFRSNRDLSVAVWVGFLAFFGIATG